MFMHLSPYCLKHNSEENVITKHFLKELQLTSSERRNKSSEIKKDNRKETKKKQPPPPEIREKITRK